MYTYCCELSDIKAYSFLSDSLVFMKNESNIDIVFCGEHKYEIEKGKVDDLVIWDEYIVISNSNLLKTMFLKDGKTIKEVDSSFHAKKNDLFLTKNRGNNGSIIEFYNKNLDVVESIEFKVGSPYLTYDNYIYTEFLKGSAFTIYNLKSKKCKNISIANYQWSSGESKTYSGKVFQILGQWKNELLVFVGRFKLISFDIETGKELWHIDDFIQEVSSNPIFDFSIGSMSGYVKWHLSESDNKAYLLVRNCLFVLDLNDKKSQFIKDYNESGEQDWYFKNSRLYDDSITFSGANELGKFPMVAGVIDRNTKEILWTTKCEPGIYFEEAPQIKDNKLYILDSEKNLHIFEKEI